LAAPELRQYLWTKLWGLDPSPEDVYNLTPWTWLVDWFSGLGDYVNAYDRINSDTSLINWGFFVYESDVRIRTDFTGAVDTQTALEGVLSPVKTEYQTHSSVAGYKYISRKSIGSVGGTKLASETASLDEFQKIILGSLLLQRHGRTSG